MEAVDEQVRAEAGKSSLIEADEASRDQGRPHLCLLGATGSLPSSVHEGPAG